MTKRTVTGAASTPATPAATPGVEKFEAAPAITFPLNAIVRNHGPIAVPEPISGAFLPAGGSATITLHDEEFAERVAASLKNIAETNYLAPGALEVGPA